MTSERLDFLIHRADTNDAPVVADLVHRLLDELTDGKAPLSTK